MSANILGHEQVQRPFSYIDAGSAGRCLDGLYQRIRSDAVVNDWCQRTPGAQLSVKTDLKFRVTGTGRIRIRRFYWSLQRIARPGNTDFNARTLVLEPDSGPQWLSFPDDPQLPAARDLLGNGMHTQVLHYVPLRRLTVSKQCANNRFTVIKLKREGRALDASRRLRQINVSDTTSARSFSLPVDLGKSLHQRAYRQTFCPGRSLGTLLHRFPSKKCIKQLGTSLAAFHTLSVNTLPAIHHHELSVFTDRVRQVIALWPAEAKRIQECHDWVLCQRSPETELTLCHGDLSLENILVNGDRWSLIDLELAHRGDPVRDIAQLLVQLEANTPGSSNELLAIQAALLSGYQCIRPNSVSSKALHWHGCRAELEYLNVAFRKDIGDARSRAASLMRAERHCWGIN